MLGLTKRRVSRNEVLEVTRASGVPVVADWLRRHPDGGWMQSGEGPRVEAARRLLFLMYLISEGVVTDGD